MGIESIFRKPKKRSGPSAEEIRAQEEERQRQESQALLAEQEQARQGLRARLLEDDEQEQIARKRLLGA